MESPHDVLSIDSDADEEEIKEAYRRRVKATHPDHGGSPREFQQVRAAYEELKSNEWSEVEPTIDGEPGSGTGPATGEEDGDDRPLESQVEYLNYEVLDDHGWGLDDDDLFEKAANAGLDPADYGRFLVQPNETVLEAAESRGFTWPYSCRGGACANCAVAVTGGEVEMPLNHVLPEELTDRDIRLSCIGTPTTGELQVVYNVKHLPEVEDLLLPPGPFREAHLND